MYLSEEAQIRDFINREFQKHFDKKLVDISQRVRLIADLYKFKLDDPFFHAQAKGKIPKFYSIYFDDEFVCRFDSTFPPEAITLLFLRGVTDLYERGKISFNKDDYKVQEEVEKYRKKIAKEEKKKKVDETIKKIKSANEESEMAAEVISSLEKENDTA
jgi:hypothetical protein